MNNLSQSHILYDRSGFVLDKFYLKFTKLNSIFFNSSPITTADKLGLFFMIVSFGVIFNPISLSSADPYHIKKIFEEVKEGIPLIEDLSENQKRSYTLIVHLKFSPESHLDVVEKVIFGKYRTVTS